MQRIALTHENMTQAIVRAAAVLRDGGITLYPTDTLYGLGADALSDEAVAKIHAIKGRDDRKPMHAVVSDLAMAAEYGEISNVAQTLVKKFGGNVTLVVPKKQEFNGGIVRGNATFGFRIPDNAFCKMMLSAFGKPITATSANRSDFPPARSIEKILEQLGLAPYSNVLQKTSIGIDLILDGGELPERKPSTVVDISDGEAVIIREGAILASEIRAALQK